MSRSRFFYALAALTMLGAPASADPAPAHVVFVGDSMADGLWGAMFRRLGKDKCLAEKVKLFRRARNGSGLTRLDQYNWVDEIDKIVATDKPDLTVASYGINDRQGIVEKDKHATPYPSPAFDTRYEAIVADTIRAAIRDGGSMVIVGLPVMLDAEANADAEAKNKIFQAALKDVGSDKATYAAPWTSGASPEVYKPYLPNARGSMTLVRASDGIHFTSTGYDMVMEAVYPALVASLKARGVDLSAECPLKAEVR